MIDIGGGCVLRWAINSTGSDPVSRLDVVAAVGPAQVYGLAFDRAHGQLVVSAELAAYVPSELSRLVDGLLLFSGWCAVPRGAYDGASG